MNNNTIPLNYYSQNTTSKYCANNDTLTIDNIVITVVESGESFRLSSVSGTLNVDASGWCTYNLNADAQFASSRANLSITTTPLNIFNWSATKYSGNESKVTIHDRTNNKLYRVYIMLGTIGGINHFVSIKKLN